MASMNNFDSDMSNSTNTVLYFNEKGDSLRLQARLHTIYMTQVGCSIFHNHIGGVMVSVLASNAVDRELQHRLGQTKDY